MKFIKNVKSCNFFESMILLNCRKTNKSNLLLKLLNDIFLCKVMLLFKRVI